MTYRIDLTDQPAEADRQALLEPLIAFNRSQAGESGSRPLALLLRDESDAVIGGLWGMTGWGWLWLQLLAVPESLRGQGLGSRLMRQAEDEALARGCHDAWLDTFDFQARPFYEGLGYACFATLPDYPRGHARFFMRKALQRGGPAGG